MNTKNIIKRIQNSPHYGIFIEIGAGVPVTSMIYNLPGASKIIHASYSPYSKDSQEEMFGETKIRAVSYEHVLFNLLSFIKNKFYTNYNKNVNFIYCSSFQLGEIGTDVSTHGWIGIAKRVDLNWEIKTIHISKHINKKRTQIINEIGKNGVAFLNSFLFNEQMPSGLNVDIIEKFSINTLNVTHLNTKAEYTQNIAEVLNSITTEDYACIKDGKLIRLEEVFRDKKEIALYKGSFAPVTLAHQKFVSAYTELKKNEVVFMISINTFEKGTQDIGNILWRIQLINKLGYTVVVNKDGYFSNNANFFRNKFHKPIAFLLGTDTINRIINDSIEKKIKEGDYNWTIDNDKDFKDVTFYVANRPNIPISKHCLNNQRVKPIIDLEDISSTKVREFKKNNDIEGLKTMVSLIIIQDYLEI